MTVRYSKIKLRNSVQIIAAAQFVLDSASKPENLTVQEIITAVKTHTHGIYSDNDIADIVQWLIKHIMVPNDMLNIS